MRRSLKDYAGYLLIDHRNSPGVTPGSLPLPTQSAETAPIVPAGQVFESGTKICAHCQACVILNPQRTRERGYCAKCDDYICDNPICRAECRPFAKALDQAHDIAEQFVGREDHPDANPTIVLTDL